MTNLKCLKYTMKPSQWISAGLAAIAIILMPGPMKALAVTLTAEVYSNGLLPLDEFLFDDGEIWSNRDILLLPDGDFTIRQNVPGQGPWTFGDGVDEFTTWVFDFTQEPEFSTFNPSKPLNSALLTVERTPLVASAISNGVQIQGLSRIESPQNPNFTVRSTERFTLDLLDYYDSSDILSAFMANDWSDSPLPNPCHQFNCAIGSHYGQIPMGYADDAVISYASLELTPVPEPSSILASIGIGVILKLKHRHHE